MLKMVSYVSDTDTGQLILCKNYVALEKKNL